MNALGTNTFGIALTGVHAAQNRMAVAAHNVANWRTPQFHPLRVTQTTAEGGGVAAEITRSPEPEALDLAREFVDTMLARTQFGASLRVIEVNSEVSGTLVDMLA